MQHLRTRTLRRLALGFASLLVIAGATPALAGPDITYPQLNNASTVQDTDLIATWRASGPLTRINASVLATYVQGKIGGSFLQTANALSELTASAATARTNLGLGTAATQSTGTSGNALCLMNTNCTWSGTETFGAAVTMNSTLGVTGAATLSGGLSVSGATGTGYNFYVDGGALGTTAGNAISLSAMHFTTPNQNVLRTLASRTANGSDWTTASITLQQIVDASNEGYITFNPAGLLGGMAFGSGGVQSATMSGAGLWTFFDGLTVSGGAVTLPAGSVAGSAIANGGIGTAQLASGAVTNAQLASGAVTNAKIGAGAVANSNLANMAASTIKGNASGSAAAPADLTATQVVGMLGLLSNLPAGGPGSLIVPTNNGNVIVNFGKMTSAGGNANTATLTFASPYSSWWIPLCSGSDGGPASVASTTNSTITCHNNVGGVQDVTWIVIGQ